MKEISILQMCRNRILVIDDDPDVQQAYRMVLSPDHEDGASSNTKLGRLLGNEQIPDATGSPRFELSFSSQGSTGVARVTSALGKNRPFSVAFIDIRMPPGIDGMETAARIRRIDPDIEIVIVTAYSDRSREEIVRAVGAPEKLLFMRKPFDAEELIQMALSLTAKWNLARQAEARTAELSRANQILQVEIAERKQAEESLRNERERLATVLDSNPIPSLILDQDHRIVFWNQSIENLTSIPREQCMGQTLAESLKRVYMDQPPPILADLILDMTDDALLRRYGHTIRRAGPGEIYKTITNIWPRGEKRILDTIATRIRDHQGNVVGAIQCAQDITDQERLQGQLQQAQKIEAIGTLAGGIAHDFNNILFPIISYTEMLLEDIPADSPFRNSLDGIYESGLRARDLVKQILAFSRQDSYEFKLMAIQPIIKEALKFIRSTIPASIEIKQDIRNDCGPIKANPTQIHQVVMNLATNAYHAMEDTGGELNVTVKGIELNEDEGISLDLEPGGYACLTIADTGMGMDRHIRGKIFDPFFTTKTKEKGTGMGLSLVHGIVKNAGGSIRVLSAPGKGTTFHVYLPVVKGPGEPHEIQTQEPIPGGTEHILLVDDDNLLLTMEKRMLERLGYQVVSRVGSLEALAAFRATPDKFDMVITDMAMPAMSGDKLAAELIKIRPDIPILLCTGFSEKLHEIKAAGMGIRGFLMKPVIKKDLARKIRDILDNH